MRYLSQYTYIREMYKNKGDRYTTQDIMEYKIDREFNKECVFEKKSLLKFFYSLYNKDVNKKQIKETLAKYECERDYNFLFQRLYKKYINEDHVLNYKSEDYSDILIL